MRPSEYFNDSCTEREFQAFGFDCFTRATPYGHRCGYVVLPPEHPLFGMSYERVYEVASIDVDGGLTFSAGTGDFWLLGWDAAHAWHKPDMSIMDDDYREVYLACGGYGDLQDCYPFASYMVDADMAQEETMRLAQQVSMMGGAS